MGYHDHSPTTMEDTMTSATYAQPFTQTPIPCVLASRYTTDRGRAVAAITIPAEHSGMGVAVDLVVADRSVVTHV